MGRPKRIRTPEEEAAHQEARRAASRERNRRQRAKYPERLRMSKRLSHQRRRQNDPGYRVMENFQRQVRRSLGGAKGHSQRAFLDIHTQEDTMTSAASSMTKGCVVAVSTDLPCSQQTQATVTTGTIGTQCALGLLISSSCQTPEEFPGFDVHSAPAVAAGIFSALRDGAVITAEAGLHTCICHTPNTGRILCNDSEAAQHGEQLHGCLSSQQGSGEAACVKMGASDYVCPACRKAFHDKGCLDTHMGAHPAKPYVCSSCQMSFALESRLRKHEKLHSHERSYMCGICRKCYFHKTHRLDHERSHSSENPCVCNICQKGFARKHDLSRHEKLHTGKTACTCDVCQRSFTSRRALAQHRRWHTNEDPHTCNVCQRAFVWKASLIKHERSHANERP